MSKMVSSNIYIFNDNIVDIIFVDYSICDKKYKIFASTFKCCVKALGISRLQLKGDVIAYLFCDEKKLIELGYYTYFLQCSGHW